MKLALLTFHHVENYGALWQVKSLVDWLQREGHGVEVLDYRPPSAVRVYRRMLFRNRHAFANALKWLKFKNYRDRHLPLGSRVFTTAEALQYAGDAYDAVIVGSDEVWNLNGCRGFDPAFFLDFVPDNTPKIAYAACSGMDTPAQEHQETIRRLLSRFSDISVRDGASQRWVQAVNGKKAPLVVDPTLLNGRRSRLSMSNHVALYGGLSPDCKQWLRKQGNRLGLKIVSVGFSNRVGGRNWISAGLDEWLQCLGSARFVITTTFHGMMAAIVHGVPFWVLPRGDGSVKVREFLKQHGLEDRYLDSGSLPQQWDPHVAFDDEALWQKLDGEIAESRKFLAHVLKSVEDQ